MQLPAAPWSINDAPRFTHRGILIDTARHFEPVPSLFGLIDSLAYAKCAHRVSSFNLRHESLMLRFNVMHWHVVDSQVCFVAKYHALITCRLQWQSFPLESKARPFLWNGSYSIDERYTTVGGCQVRVVSR